MSADGATAPLFHMLEPYHHHLNGTIESVSTTLISQQPSVSFPILPSNASVTDTLYYCAPAAPNSCILPIYSSAVENTKFHKKLAALELTPQQERLLEKKFSENSKPNKERRETIAEELGLSLEKVKNWFTVYKKIDQLNKKKLERDFTQKLNEVGELKKKDTGSIIAAFLSGSSGQEMANSLSLGAVASQAFSQNNPTAGSSKEIMVESHSENPYGTYASPADAALASLKRAVDEGKKANPLEYARLQTGADTASETTEDTCSAKNRVSIEYSLNPNDPNFYPVSAFSDWGSSASSISSWAPTPAGQAEDPFEYDTASVRGSPAYTEFQDISANCSAGVPLSMVPVCYQDEYAQFVIMADMNAAMASVNMSLRQPPASRRPSDSTTQIEAVVAQQEEDLQMTESDSRQPSLARSLTCPDLLADWEDLELEESQTSTSQSESDDDRSTVTSQKIRKMPPRLPRSNSFNGNIPILSAESHVKKSKVSLRSRVNKVREAKLAAVPKSPLHLEQFSDGQYFDHTAESSVQCESDASSIISMDADPFFSGRYTPPTPISPSEQYSISKAEPRIAEVARDLETMVPKPQRLADFRRIFELTTPMVEDEISEVEPQFASEDISFFGLEMLPSAFEPLHGTDLNKYPECLDLGYPVGLDVPPAPPMAYGSHGASY